MKKLIPAITLLTVVLFAFFYNNQVIAQNNQSDSQLSPMNVFPTESAQNPEDSKQQLPLLNTDPLPSLPSPANPTADIGEQVAAKIALEIVAKRFKAINSKVIKSSLISYKEALQQLPEPVGEDHPLAKTQVRLVEISGTFQGRSRRLVQGVTTSPRTFTKAYIILRNADGFLLGTTLLK